MTVLDLAALLVATLPTALLVVFVAEVVAGLRPLPAGEPGGDAPATTVLIPAHDEAAGIAATIEALRAGIPDTVRVLVVADNCTDDTAALARAAGAEVVERTDPARRGKGYALAFGRRALEAGSPPACVVVLDADCTVAGAGVAALARAAFDQDRAVQGRNLQRPDLSAPARAQLSNFAFMVKNLIRQRGMIRLGRVAALTGTGMALPWADFASAPLATSDLAEDLALGVWLTRHRRPPTAEESVHIWSDAADGSAMMAQRRRWEGGFLATARGEAWPLIVAAIAARSRSRLWLGLHLMVPPLALLFAVAGAALAIVVAITVAGASPVAAVVLTAAMAAAGGATVAAWLAEGRGRVDGRALLTAPLYIFRKLPLYRTLLRPQDGGDGWVRTRRPGEARRPN